MQPKNGGQRRLEYWLRSNKSCSPPLLGLCHLVGTDTEYLLYSSWWTHAARIIFLLPFLICKKKRKDWVSVNQWEMQERRKRAGSITQWLHNLRYWPANLRSCRAIKFGPGLITAYLMWHFWQIQSTRTALAPSLICAGLSQCVCVCVYSFTAI